MLRSEEAAQDSLVEVAHKYRMQTISEIQQWIEREREKRAMLSKKYHRGVKVINTVDDALIVVTMGLGASGIGVLSTVMAAPIAIAITVMAAPIVIAMEAGALATGLLSIVCGQVSKKLAMKAEKHEMIKTLAEAKLNTIIDHIS